MLTISKQETDDWDYFRCFVASFLLHNVIISSWNGDRPLQLE